MPRATLISVGNYILVFREVSNQISEKQQRTCAHPGVRKFSLSENFCERTKRMISCTIKLLPTNYHRIKYVRERVFTSAYFPCRDDIKDSVLLRENTGQRKPVFSHILYIVYARTFWSNNNLM